MQPATQQWDAAQYAANGRFVANLAGEIVAWLAPQPGERILDLGCGDGALTATVAQSGALLTGVELDPSMAAAAQQRGLRVHQQSMTDLAFNEDFDAVFSNAALHWVPDQPAVLRGVHGALVLGGRFVAEMGGLGNIASIRVALSAVCRAHGIDAEAVAASFYPSAAEYTALLHTAGFRILRMETAPRPTLLRTGMEEWLRTFRRAVLAALPAQQRQAVLDETVRLLQPALQDSTGAWWADYVRLRFHAVKL